MSDAPERIWADALHPVSIKARWGEWSEERHPTSEYDTLYIRAEAAEARIAALERERDEALRRRDAWRERAKHYPELAAAVREKVKEAGPSVSRMVLRAYAAEMEAENERLNKERDEAREAVERERERLIAFARTKRGRSSDFGKSQWLNGYATGCSDTVDILIAAIRTAPQDAAEGDGE